MPTTRSSSRRSPCAASRSRASPASPPTSTSTRSRSKKGQPPTARVELEVQTKGGPIKRQVKRVTKGTRLHDLVRTASRPTRTSSSPTSSADRRHHQLSNGDVVVAGQLADRDVTEETKRRIQIREVIRAHLDKERELFARASRSCRCSSSTRSPSTATTTARTRSATTPGCSRRSTRRSSRTYLGELDLDEATAAYREYLSRDRRPRDCTRATSRSTRRPSGSVDGDVHKTGDEKGQSKDVEAYDLILKDKERLLSFEEPVRFIFSHSALREGWDNPNVFVMGMLKKSDNTISRRQEIGRGLRLAVDQHGERMDNPVTVHDINELTVVTDESYTDFVAGAAEGDRRVAGGAPAQGQRQVLHRQDDPHRRIGESRCRGGARAGALQVPGQERLHQRRRHGLRRLQGGQGRRDARRADLRGPQAGHRLRLAAGRRALHRPARCRPTAASRRGSRSTRRTSRRRSSRSSGAGSTTRPSTRSSSTRPS